MTAGFHLAQVNIARARAPIDSPVMAGFVALLEEINALAERSPGFVWRLQTEAGDATALRPYEDDRVLVNLSVWSGIDELKTYVYRSAHSAVMRRRREWFERFDGFYLALWWVPAGHLPTVEEAKQRLRRLELAGPGPDAFTFAQVFPPPGGSLPVLDPTLEATCP
jgi:hypothetical protein